MKAHFIVFCAVLGLFGCASSTEGMRRSWDVRIPFGAAPDAEADRVVKTQTNTPFVEECLARGERMLPGVSAEVLMPTYDLAALDTIQSKIKIHLRHEKHADYEMPPRFNLGPMIGQVILTSPNAEALQLKKDGTDMLNDHARRENFAWRLAWEQSGDAWATNELAVQFSTNEFSVLLPDVVNFHEPTKGIEDEDIRERTISIRLETGFLARLLSPSYAGFITFRPRVMTLVQDERIVGCLPTDAIYAEK